MRLDKYLSSGGELSRTEAKSAIRSGRAAVNGVAAEKGDMQIDPEKDEITLDGKHVLYSKYVYIMLNKPAGVVSATEDGRSETVLDLLPDKYKKLGLFPCGRLDKDTVGLMILTNDGKLAHNMLSPKHHVEKVYYFTTEKPVENVDILESGVKIGKDIMTRPCVIDQISEYEGEITLTEGKYHQIKLMFEAVGNKIVYLKRIRFAGIPLDESLAESCWRLLSDDEVKTILQYK